MLYIIAQTPVYVRALKCCLKRKNTQHSDLNASWDGKTMNMAAHAMLANLIAPTRLQI